MSCAIAGLHLSLLLLQSAIQSFRALAFKQPNKSSVECVVVEWVTADYDYAVASIRCEIGTFFPMISMPPSRSAGIQITWQFGRKRKLRGLGKVGMMQDVHSRTHPARPLERFRTILEVQYAATYHYAFG
jgi:hypothetical protein